MARPLPVAVVGVGKLGAIHARILRELGKATLAGVQDKDPRRARDVAREQGCPVLPDLESVAASARAAVVAVPTREHLAVASCLLEAGLPCLVEKPLAATPAAGRELVDLARTRHLPLMTGHVERFNPAVLALLELGLKPAFLEAQRVAPYSFRSADVGVVMDVMIHDIDLILHLVEAPATQIHAVGVGVLGEQEDMANARLVFENGAVANVTASRVALKVERKLRLFAQDCYVSLDLSACSGRIVRPGRNLKRLVAEGRLDLGRLSPLEAMLKKVVRSSSLKVNRRIEPLKAELLEFVNAIQEGRPPAVTGQHGVVAMEVAQRVLKSLQQNLASQAGDHCSPTPPASPP